MTAFQRPPVLTGFPLDAVVEPAASFTLPDQTQDGYVNEDGCHITAGEIVLNGDILGSVDMTEGGRVDLGTLDVAARPAAKCVAGGAAVAADGDHCVPGEYIADPDGTLRFKPFIDSHLTSYYFTIPGLRGRLA